jgi:DNA-binding NtrC family response regulator
MITGETGVGKELFARALHAASDLAGEFVPLNVAGLDAHLFEDTLFGHRKGAFTGASDHREGLIARAHNGTLFLDEIGDLTAESQIKLLRLLQDREYYRLGSDLLQKCTARIIVATNRDLEELVAKGEFREDLFHRLRYHRLQIPPLREHPEDILLLVDHAVTTAAATVGKPSPRVSTELRILLTHYDYPGNVRELLNMVSAAVVANRSGVLTRGEFPQLTPGAEGEIRVDQMNGSGQFSLHMVFPAFPTMDQVERVVLREALKITGKKMGAAADLLGICRQTVKRKLAEMGMEKG